MCQKSQISDLVESEVHAAETAEDGLDSELSSTVQVTGGHDRSRVLQVRLNDDEYRILQKLAEERGVPASTFARALLLQTIGA